MNATERAALLRGVDLYDEMSAALDDRTLEILDRRRRTAVVRRRGWLMRRMLLLADVVGLLAAFALAEWIISRRNGVGTLDARAEMAAFVITLPAWIVVAKLYGLYDQDEERTDHSTADDFAGVFHMVTVCTWLFAAGSYVTNFAHAPLSKLVLFWITAVALVSVGRASARTVVRRSVVYLQNTVIVGAGDVGQLIAKKLLQHPEYGINLVGFIDADPKERDDDLGHLAVLGDTSRLMAIVRLFDIERVIIAFSNERHEDTLDLLRELKDLDVQIDIVPRLFETVGPNVGVHMVEGLPLVGLPPLRLSRSSMLLKRTMDVVLSAIALVMLAPLFALIALLIKLDSSGPVFYRHDRIGHRGRPFRLFKFRTMHFAACRGADYGGEGAEEEFQRLMGDPLRRRQFETAYKMQDDPRVTRVGRVLRKMSIDEFPQLINVLLGDISLVGPRPVTADELERYGEGVSQFLSIRPGITGYWQINGRSRLEYEDRVRLDLAYVSSWSLGLDLQIIAKTLRVLFGDRSAC